MVHIGLTTYTHDDAANFYHGTTMTGIISARTNNNIGAIGVAGGWGNKPGVKCMILKANSLVYPWCTEMALVDEALRYACDNGARVINMAFGVSGGNINNFTDITKVINDNYDKGIVFLAATGNEDIPIVSFPANHPKVIAVGGVNIPPYIPSGENIDPYSDFMARWSTDDYGMEAGSNYGPEVDISAPAFLAHRCKVSANSTGQPISDYELLYEWGAEDHWPTRSGTSGSVAYTSGVVALMLSVDSCIYNDTIEAILEETAIRINECASTPCAGDYVYDSDGHCDEVGNGLVNAYAAVKKAMGYSDLIITSNTTWRYKELRIRNTLTIAPNAELFLDHCTLNVLPGGRIIVKPGGRLIVDGGYLRTHCVTWWSGVEIEGDFQLSQIPSSNQGFVHIFNNARVENAHYGFLVKPGGILLCENVTFINNAVGIALLNYSGNNVSEISNSTFNINDNYFVWYQDENGINRPKFDCHIFLSHVNDVDIKGNNFNVSCTFEHSDFPYEGIGIVSSNSNFNVIPICTQSPCEDNPDRNTFSGLNYGIRAVAYGLKSFTVNNSQFNNTYTGIFASGYIKPEITLNSFDIVAANDLLVLNEERNSCGIYMDNCSGFHVEKNVLLSTYQHDNVGIYIKNSGTSSNYIYNNKFTNLATGSIAEGINYNNLNPISGTGLCYRCNEFEKCSFDLFVVDDERNPTGVRHYQGSPSAGLGLPQSVLDTLAAGNVFTDLRITRAPSNWDNLQADYTIEYFHHNYSFEPSVDPMRLIPFISHGNTVCNLNTNYQKSVSCKSWLNKTSSESKLVQDYSSSLLQQKQTLETLSNLQDGGNTENTLDYINYSFPEDAFVLYDTLLVKSPYLSDTTISQVIEREDVIDNSLLKEIFKANPNACRSQKLLEKLNERNIVMSDEMYAEIEVASTINNPHSELLIKYSELDDKKSRAFNDLTTLYLNDTVDRVNDLISIVDQDSSLYAEDFLIRYFLSKSDYSSIAARISSMNNRLFNHTDIESIINEYTVLLSIISSVNDSIAADSAILTQLEIIKNNGHFPTSYLAEQIKYSFDLDFVTERFADPENLNLRKVRVSGEKNSLTNMTNTKLSLYPNPTSDYIILQYDVVKDKKYSFEIRNMKGDILTRINNNTSGSEVISVKSFKPGLYIIFVISENKILDSAKFSVI